MCGHCEALFNNIVSECDANVYFQIGSEFKKYFSPDSVPFGNAVFESFRDARDDIAAASRCLAFDESNACVFHLMRALERALHL